MRDDTQSPMVPLQNWSGNLHYSTNKIYYPETVSELQQMVESSPHLRALGTRHCFNEIADSDQLFISSAKLHRIIELNTVNQTVTVEGGIKYGELSPYLDQKGYGLHNLASLPHISVAGSISTATHGSGASNGNLATAVRALEIVTADGTVLHLSKEKDREVFDGAVVGLGAMGIISCVTLAIEPSYQMQQWVYTDIPIAQLKDHFFQIMTAGYSVSLFTNWEKESINEVWIKGRTDPENPFVPPKEFYGALPATRELHPIFSLSPENCTAQLGRPGAWYDRLPHFKMGFTPSSGKELQSEYFIPQQHAVEAILAVARLGNKIGPLLLISEIRTIAADTLWMSPCRNQESVAIHFTWKPQWDAVKKLLPLIEKELAPFGARPHWGKLFTLLPAILKSSYEKLDDFKKLAGLYDPKGKFRNDFLKRYLY